jgi:predicted metalloprotease
MSGAVSLDGAYCDANAKGIHAMRWEDLPESQNIEDRRGAGGGGFGMPGGAGGLSIGTVVVLGIIGYALGIDPSVLIGGAEMLNRERAPTSQAQPGQTRTLTEDEKRTGQFVTRVLGSTEATWARIFKDGGGTYRPPVLVLYSGRTHANCGGQAMAAMGPFYCPADRKIYLDTSFFRMIETRFKGCDVGSQSCRFAQAYVIAHEVAHHVQNLLGVLARAQQQQRAVGDKVAANRIQVQVELQADCYSGIWANKNNERLAPGDIEAALRTAAAIGDDTLQRRAGGAVVPDSFTHGSSAQRQRWFETGYKQGTVASCNTFAASAQL